MEVDQPQTLLDLNGSSETQASTPFDLVGGSFAVIESDPGLFTSLTRRLGIHGLELVEMYDIEPWAVDHLNPYGLIFCFMWHKDSHRPADFEDPAAERVWFANQLSDDACATQAILNVLLNCPDIDIGEELQNFKEETKSMSPVMRGLAITNSPIIRPAHNSLARPVDIRASLNNLTIATFNAEKRKALEKKTTEVKPPPAKRAKTATPVKSRKVNNKGKEKAQNTDKEEEEETYHFIGYVPAYGKVWELDGLKSGPLEVGELPEDNSTKDPNRGWMDVVRPALRMKMEKYGGSGNDGSNIRFSLLAIVDDLYQKASDELELLKREKIALERRLEAGWETSIDPALYESSKSIFVRVLPHQLSTPYAKDFGSRKMDQDLKILQMSQKDLVSAWETCIQNGMRAKIAVEDELAKGMRANTDHVKRTFDYEPFIREYTRSLHREGILDALLGQDSDGNKSKVSKPSQKL